MPSHPTAVPLPEHKRTINQHRTESGPLALWQGADGFSFHPGYSDVQDGTYPPETRSISEVLCKITFVNTKCNVIIEIDYKIGICIYHLSAQSDFSTHMVGSGKGQI